MPTHNHTGTTNNSSTGNTLNNSANVANTNSHTVRGVKSGIAADDSTCADGNNANLSLTDPTHNHTFATSNTGLSNAHNNMQPTLFYGNMFVFSGIYGLGNFPYTANTNIA
jgi:microcystin-dependent protein